MTADISGQRWNKPLNVEPGHWKKQLPGKYGRIAAKGDLVGLKALLADQPDNLNRRGPHGRTLLWEAVRAGKSKAVQFLLEAGADTILTGCYNSESHVQLTPYCAAVQYGRDQVADHLKSVGAAPDIYRRAFLGDRSGVIAELEANPELLTSEDPHDEIFFIPLLSFAVAGGHAGLTSDLIGKGAEVASYSSQLLFIAAKMNRTDLIESLVSHGARPYFIEAALISTGDIEIFRKLVSLRSNTANSPDQDQLSLLPFVRGDRACRADKLATLLEYGVATDISDSKGRTALHLAASGGQLPVIELLLDHGADPGRCDDTGNTPLDAAREAGKEQAKPLLLGGSGKR